MRVGRAEALDLFRKWASEGALLRCDFGFAEFAASFRGRIREVAEESLKLSADDTVSELVLPLPDGLVFWYADPRGFTKEATVFECGLTVSFPGRIGATRDTLTFNELKDPPRSS